MQDATPQSGEAPISQQSQLTILAGVIVLALVSVGAYLLTRQSALDEPNASLLPATPAAPSEPPVAVQGSGVSDITGEPRQ